MIFTWFDNPRLRPRIQANQAWGFHYPSLSRLQMLTRLLRCQWTLQQEIIFNLLTQVYPNTYNLSRIKITNEFSLSHNVFDYKWMRNVWIKEIKTSLKLNNGYMLSSKLSDSSWIYSCLNLIESFYNWR